MVDPRYRRAVEDEVMRWPGVGVSFEDRGGKHPFAEFRFRDRARKYWMPASASDGSRGIVNCITDLRRLLMGLGAVRLRDDNAYRADKPREHRPPREAGPTKIKPFAPPPPIPDPRAALLDLKLAPIRAALQKHASVRLNQERKDEAAMVLIAGWHPDLIERALDLINQARKAGEKTP